MKKFTRVRKIEGKTFCEIYEVEYGPQKIKACAKLLKFTHESQLNKLINEMTNLSSVKNLKMGLKYIDYLIDVRRENNIDVKYFVIITEYCSKGNLGNLIIKRRDSNDPFLYPELAKIFFDLVEFFKTLQDRGISHRDIKPDNFFIDENNQIKVGDFGSSKELIEMYNNINTIIGTPNYLSPELRDGYQKYKDQLCGKYMEYLPYKSDVYSLGLVFLYMITMEKLDVGLDLDILKKTVSEKLKRIKHENIRELLTLMLVFDQENRPDFKKLFEVALTLFSKNVCFICRAAGDDLKTVCQECEICYHHGCISGDICANCGAKIKNLCNECKSIEILKCEIHKLCRNCGFRNIDCQSCLGFEIFECSNEEFHFYGCRFSCYTCKNLLNPETTSKSVECSNCGESWCQICKRIDHMDSCTDNPEMIKIYCLCGGSHSFLFSSTFYYCPRQGSVCLVCMKSSNDSHLRCSQMLNHSLS
jgi:serine/threonine protein kinase